jgi:hypothetical protein
MIGRLYRATWDRRWNRDRRRLIARMLEQEHLSSALVLDWAEAMAVQLAEIRALPEAPDRCR